MSEVVNYSYNVDIQTKNDTKSFFELLFLMHRYSKYLFDDEFLDNPMPYCQKVFNLVKENSPYFWLFKDEKKVKGFCYLYNVVPYKGRPYSAFASICFDKSCWGARGCNAAKNLLDEQFKALKIAKIKAECFSKNRLAVNFLKKLGFKAEAYLKNETILHGKPADTVIWSIFNPYLTTQNK